VHLIIHNRATIRAELISDDTATAAGIAVTARPPVTELCRALIEAGHDPDLRLEAWRGSTLCLTVKSIVAAARLTADESTGCRFVRFRGKASGMPDSASPVRQNGQAMSGYPARGGA
jgi:hypothetical protein